MSRRKSLLLTLTFLWLLSWRVLPSQAAPAPFCEFYGFVTIDGTSLTDPVSVSAWIGDVKIGETTCIVHGPQSLYLLKIPRDGLERFGGCTVTFRVGDWIAEQSAVLPDQRSQRISLNAAEPAARPIPVRFEGLIEDMVTLSGQEAVWTVDGQSLVVNAETVIEPVGYPVAEGDWVKVNATGTPEQLIADHINVRIGAIEAPPFEFVGAIETIQDEGGALTLIVAGTRVLTDEQTEVIGELAVGHVAQVVGDQQPDRSVLARQINTESPQDALAAVQFEDEITEIQDDYWFFGDPNRPENWVKVWIVDAEIPVQGHVGLSAEVSGTRLADGSVKATRIQVQTLNPFDEIRFSGIVTDLGRDAWVVDRPAGAQIVYLDAHTFVDESRAPAILGSLAHVMAVQRQDGTLLAIRIAMARAE